MDNIEIYILTHKKIDEEYDDNIYKPLLCGSDYLQDDFGYLKDNSGVNISKLNPFFSELTGQYWVWKNSKASIIGFCHYRRFFSNGVLYNKLSENEILRILKNYDIILPIPFKIFNKTQQQHFEEGLVHTSFSITEFLQITGKIIKKESPEYYNAYENSLNDHYFYHKNMFICKKEIADDYFKWCFKILEGVCIETNLLNTTKNHRVLGYISEILLDVYVKKNNLKIKEKPLIISNKCSPLYNFVTKHNWIMYLIIKFKKIL